MTRQADWHEPSGVPAPPRLLAPTLAILAQFDSEQTVLDQTDVTRITGCLPMISQRCLVSLAELGYLAETPSGGGYRLAGCEPCPAGTGLGEDGTLDTAA